MERDDVKKIYLPYLDGLRGFGSLYVVFCHLFLMERCHGIEPIWHELSSRAFKFGTFAVAIFIVLSGYCLMLPVVRSRNGYIPGGLKSYFWRRGRRILPTYYAALIFCLLLSALILILKTLTHFSWSTIFHDQFLTDFSYIDVLLHFLLIHNLTTGVVLYNINSPMWSIALEWQIYFIFPLLLPLWRGWNCWVVMVVAFVIGLVPYYLIPNFMELSHPWFLSSFVLGMIAADIGFSNKPYMIRLNKYLPWNVFLIIFSTLAVITSEISNVDRWIPEICFSIAAACLMIYSTNYLMTENKLPILLKTLQSPLATTLGSFSYSLYLTHAPIITLLRHLLIMLNLPVNIFGLVLYLTGTIVSIGFAYIFYLLFERKFTLKNQVLS